MANTLRDALIERLACKLVEQRLTQTIDIPDPAAGAVWAQVVPGGQRWELLSVTFRIVTSAIVANRAPRIVIQDSDNNVIANFVSANTVAASNNAFMTFAAGYGDRSNISGWINSLPTPPYLLPNAWKVALFVSNIDAADQISLSILRVVQWSETDVAQASEMVAEQIENYYGKHVSSVR